MAERKHIMPEDMSRPRRFVYYHGRKMADGASWARLALGVVSAGALLADKPKLAQRAHVLGVITDKVDGVLADLSKEGKTQEGGRLDQRVDKLFTAVTEAAMTYKGRLKDRHIQVRMAADLAMTVIRHHKEKQGIETSAAPLGQKATAVVVVADSLSMTRIGQRYPRVTEFIHHVGDSMKLARLHDSPRVWQRRHREKLNRETGEETVLFEEAA